MADVFVFGSNLAGRHGKGAALHARKYFGAVYGQGIGRMGNSYGIPTKGMDLEVLPLGEINVFVQGFLNYAKQQYWESFNVTAIGCGLAGYTPEEIAPMFANAPENVNLPKEFREVLNKTTKREE
jgi:hypothetical protein